MKPDLKPREIDALVAEKVMLWPFPEDCEAFSATDETWCYRHPKKGVLKGTAYYVKYAPEGTKYSRDYKRWSPTTDIAAAMDVVEKMKSEGYSVFMDDAHNGKWTVCFYKPDGEATVYHHGQADTLELAICLAALRAKGVSV